MTDQKGTDMDKDLASKIMADAAEKTYDNRKGKIGEIKVIEQRGLHRIITINLGEYRLMLNSDGIGTKIGIAEKLGRHTTIAYDLFAMLCDDSVRFGAEPISMSNILDMNKFDKNVLEQLAEGMVKAANEAGISVSPGETAKLGSRVRGYGEINYNWGGVVLSILRKEITGKDIIVGDSIVGLAEPGFRSNGYSLLEEVMHNHYGTEWHLRRPYMKEKLGEQAIKPSKIYTKAVLEMFPYAKGIAHITGGGIPEKLGRVLKVSGFGAEIDNPFSPYWLMRHCQKIGNVSDEESYRVWNMGHGNLIITDEPEPVIREAANYNIEAQVVGKIIEEPKILIKSRGYFSGGENLTYDIIGQ